VHRRFFYLCHQTQGGSHINESTPIASNAIKAITPVAIAITLIIIRPQLLPLSLLVFVEIGSFSSPIN